MPFWKRRLYGFTFVFKSDPADDQMAHIYARHLKTEADAMRIFFAATATYWNDEHNRFESFTDTEGLYWFWQDEAAQRLMVISCFNGRSDN